MARYKQARAVTCRIDPDDWDYIFNTGRGRSFNSAMKYFIRIVRDMEAEGLAEIRGYFMANEWKFMADALKRHTEPIWSKNELQLHIMNIRHMEAKSSYYGVEPAALCEKISALTAVHVLALTQRIHEFWERSEAVSMDEWARY